MLFENPKFEDVITFVNFAIGKPLFNTLEDAVKLASENFGISTYLVKAIVEGKIKFPKRK